MCKSKQGHCGVGPKFCGTDCESGSCTKSQSKSEHQPDKIVEHHNNLKANLKSDKKEKHHNVSHSKAKPGKVKPGKVKPGKGKGKEIINEKTFQCAFNGLNAKTRKERLGALRKSGWKPGNKDEAAVFLAHVYHETGGLKQLNEKCAPGKFTFLQIRILLKFDLNRLWWKLCYIMVCSYSRCIRKILFWSRMVSTFISM
jgi:hypothetical protein